MSDIKNLLTDQGYEYVRYLEGRGWLGLNRRRSRPAIMVGLDEDLCYVGRYCYDSMAQALHAVQTWDGKTDPEGEWVHFITPTGEIRPNPDCEGGACD